jgi:hypothetical protein
MHPFIHAYSIHVVNAPWKNTPLEPLKDYYWKSYQIVQTHAPHWVTLLHDSGRLSLEVWGDFMQNCPNWALTTHSFQAWSKPVEPMFYATQACDEEKPLTKIEKAGIPVVRK